ncbi:MAG: PepSY-associated TM helix domain-containing protein [Pseudomonadota bacterium]
MSVVNREQNKRLVAVHGWSGTLLGLLLYVVIITGAVAVFAHEIGVWSAGGTRSHHPLSQPINDRLVELSQQVDPAYVEEVQVFANNSGLISAFFHTHTQNADGNLEDKGVRFFLDPNSLEIVDKQEGYRSSFPRDPASALHTFIAILHINLHIPRPWGLWATGIVGFVMLTAVVSGIILHKHLLQDIFVAPRLSSLLLNRRDRHLLSGSWSLPFGFVLSFTGIFFSFAGALGLPIVAMVAFGGDQMKVMEVITGTPPLVDERPAPLANLDTIIADSKARNISDPLSVVVNHWGRADAQVTLFHEAAGDALTGRAHLFSGSTGDYLGVKPLLGTEESVGGFAVGLIGPLHFGNFGGLLSKVVWFALGIASAYVTITGLELWLARRREDVLWQRFDRARIVFQYGTPVALIGAGFGYFLSPSLGVTHSWTAAGFCLVAGLCFLPAFFMREERSLVRLLASVMGLGLILLPFVRMAASGVLWDSLFASGNALVIGVDLVLALSGIATLYLLFGLKQSEVVEAPQTIPAE